MEHYKTPIRPFEIVKAVLLIIIISLLLAIYGVSRETNVAVKSVSDDTQNIVSGKFTGIAGEKVGEDIRFKQQHPEYDK